MHGSQPRWPSGFHAALFAVSLKGSCRRYAQLAKFSTFLGQKLLWSWCFQNPSQGHSCQSGSGSMSNAKSWRVRPRMFPGLDWRSWSFDVLNYMRCWVIWDYPCPESDWRKWWSGLPIDCSQICQVMKGLASFGRPHQGISWHYCPYPTLIRQGREGSRDSTLIMKGSSRLQIFES